MRRSRLSIRLNSRVIAALPFSLLIAGPALQAQYSQRAPDAKLFQDSWFWGVHAGATTIGTPARSTGAAPTIGGEWFITRTAGGLYASYDQANFTGTSSVPDGGAPNGLRNVAIHDLRTVSVAALVFPFQARSFRPYAGLGFALSTIGSASPESMAPGDTVSAASIQRADNGRSRAGILVMGGLQWQIRRTAVFGQVSSSPRNSDFLINKPITTITGGVRYNFGSSIER